MTAAERTAGDLWVERRPGLGDAGVWCVSEGGSEGLGETDLLMWSRQVERLFAADPEVASVSVVTLDDPRLPRAWLRMAAGPRRADAAALPQCFLSGLVAELIGLPTEGSRARVSRAEFDRWTQTATRKGLAHFWWIGEPGVEHDLHAHTVPGAVAGDVDRPKSEGQAARPEPGPASLSLGIDAAWLLSGESGAQVFVFEMIKELARRASVDRIALISDAGSVPRALAGVPKVEGVSWREVASRPEPIVDVLHRPYQPTAEMDIDRYRRVGRTVVLTVLDFIAYDNPAYHESAWAWRRHRARFDEQVCLADGVFAISGFVAARLEEQYGARLHEPVRAVLLGTDHLAAAADDDVASLGADVRALGEGRFLLVLGNDFEHKNRDFAVRVFAELCDRSYDGQLVLAGFHLDLGSSYGHELDGAGRHASRVVRLGAVPAAEKAWLLRRADVVLYPTSAEGFGLVPFEAAALGTPVAFVRFGPLRETMPGVDACDGWQVRPFADLVSRLLADPNRQVAQVRTAAAALTWAAHVDKVLDGYGQLLSPGAAWRTRRPRLPGPHVRAYRALDALAYRVSRRARRLIGPDRPLAAITRTS